MAQSTSSTLNASPRDPDGSRATRRLRREGQVPGVLYGGEGEPVSFSVDGRELRAALHASGAVVDLVVGGTSEPAVLKDAQRHPVRGEMTHVDFVRVNLNVAIQAIVPLIVIGAEESPGVVEGGVVDQPIREVNVEALPNEIPESIEISAAELNIGETAPLSAAIVPSGVTLLDEADLVVVSLLAPRLEVEETIEEETALIGEDGESAEGASDEGDGGDGDGGGDESGEKSDGDAG
jgi:large subunit ribosomal protein L25